MPETVEERIERRMFEALKPQDERGEGEISRGPVSTDSVERKIEERMMKEFSPSAEEEKEKEKPEFASRWSMGHEIINHLNNGALTRSTLGRIERDAWSREHPLETLAAKEIPSALAAAGLSTGAGRLAEAGATAMGAPALGEALTGTLAARGAGMLGRGLSAVLARTAPQRFLAQSIPGAWQGALSGALFPGKGETRGEAAARSAAEGAGLGPLGHLLTGGLRSSISPANAQKALARIAQGVPVQMNEIPGASRASKSAGAVARLLGMSRPDHSAFTQKLMESTGSKAKVLSDVELTNAAKDAQVRYLSAQTAQDKRLAANQIRNVSILRKVPYDSEGIVNPQALHAQVSGQTGGVEREAVRAQNAGNPVNMGTLANTFPTSPGIHPAILGGGLAAAGGAALAEHEFGAPIISAAMEHPWAASALGALGASNIMGGFLQNAGLGSWRPYMDATLNRAARGAGRGFYGSVASPLITQRDRETPGTGPLSQSEEREKIISEAQAQGEDPAVMLAIGQQESGLRHEDSRGRVITSHLSDGSIGGIGLLQINPKTAKQYGIDPYDVDQNRHFGVQYYKEMREKFGNRDLAVAAYNAGPGRVQAYRDRGVPLPPETTNYVRNILGNDLTKPYSLTVNPRPGYFTNTQSVNDNPNLLTGGIGNQ
jgi:soluble lytic murein transglycosylase-like protein